MYTDTSRNVIWSLPFLASLAFAQTSRGCYKIDSSLSSLGSYAYQSTGYCLTQCSGSRSAVFALTAGDQCLCGNSLPAGGSVDSSNCNIACTGYPSDNCKSPDREIPFILWKLTNYRWWNRICVRLAHRCRNTFWIRRVIIGSSGDNCSYL